MRALREAIKNAVMDRDWFVQGANVFVEIYTDRIEVVSPGSLPSGLTLADFGTKSARRNALIADLLHRIDFIEKAGTGIRRIRSEARVQGCPDPEFEANGFFTAVFRPNPEVRPPERVRVINAIPAELAREVRLLVACAGEMGRRALQRTLGLKSDSHFRKAYLLPALLEGLIEMTIPERPQSRNQRYRLTAAGREALGCSAVVPGPDINDISKRNVEDDLSDNMGGDMGGDMGGALEGIAEELERTTRQARLLKAFESGMSRQALQRALGLDGYSHF